MVKRPASTYKSNTTVSGVLPTAVQIVAPGSNVRGMIVHGASIAATFGAAGAISEIVATSASPASYSDGIGILSMCPTTQSGGSFSAGQARREDEVFIPAGYGLYAISDVAETTARRYVEYTLL